MKIQLGSVSEATLRNKDLIPRFIDTALNINPNNIIAKAMQDKIDDMDEDQRNEYWESEDADWDVDNLFNLLNDMCYDDGAEYVFFGAHQGDGACFGFWIDYDGIEQDEKYGDLDVITEEDEIPTSGTVVVKYSDYSYSLYRDGSLIWSV